MKQKKSIVILIILCVNSILFAQETEKGIIGGKVISSLAGEHIPYAKVYLKEINNAVLTDETGTFSISNIPFGTYTIIAESLGYIKQERNVTVSASPAIIQFELAKDYLAIEQIIVSANRTEQTKKEASIVVSTISPQMFNLAQAPTLADGLNFSPGLRLENNCQNCGFTQVRMNGLDGAYSQILINGRPIFSGLAGVYGLELIPASMIRQVEVVRGGGSALYGGSAIAGTINLILQDPITNSYQFGTQASLIGVGFENPSTDLSANFNTSTVSESRNIGLSIYGFTRRRTPFDANNDDFSEISSLVNNTVGTRFFYRQNRSKITLDAFSIYEDRAGGNMFDSPYHERDIAEAVTHNLYTTALTYERFFRSHDLFSVYGAGQFLNRDSYYGAEQSLSDYGNSQDYTYNTGIEYKAQFIDQAASLIIGVDNTGNFLTDKKLGYLDIDNAIIEDNTIIDIPHVDNMLVADQAAITTGFFTQYEQQFKQTKITVGARYDIYSIYDRAKQNERKTGTVLSPRISIKQDITSGLIARAGYAKGYRAPQLFDEDLHIETSGSRQVIHENDPNLTQETSHGITTSLDYTLSYGNVQANFIVEGFYTRLLDPFVNEFGEPDDNGVVVYSRTNDDDGATVQGVNLELQIRFPQNISVNSGFTIQSSKYDEEQEFDEVRFFRSPNNYGFMSFDWDITKKLNVSFTGTYTGSMLVPYFGENAADEDGELRTSNQFFDAGVKLEYKQAVNGSHLIWFVGMNNIFNSYQKDFDEGIDRDPGYIYGPNLPRTLNLGLRIGNLL